MKASRRPTEPRRPGHPAQAPGRLAGATLAALMAAAPGPSPLPTSTRAPVPGSSVRFVDVPASAGIELVNVNGEPQKTTVDETVGEGICLNDVDGDGRIDVFVPNGSRKRPFPPGQEP